MTADDKTRIQVSSRFAPGVRLNDTYQLDELIASGGMGQVFRGHNIETEEPVAIKTILSELADDDTIFALFKKEGLILGRLNHPTIVRYYAFSRDPRIGRPYLVMEYVEGQSLAERMSLGPLPIDDAYQLFARVAEGLSLAHKAGVVHRDLSPDNIIIQHGSLAEPKVIDFGIAHAANASTTLLGSSFAGKFSFVSPEQIGLAGSQVTNRSDIYSLGLVIVAALRGKPLNMGTMPAEVIDKRRSVPDLGDIDAGIRPLIEQMLQPEAANRPESMGYIADWLAQAGGLSTKASRLDTESTSPWMPTTGGGRFVPHVTPILPGRPTTSPLQAAMAAAPVNHPGRRTSRRSRLPLVAGLIITAGAVVLAAYFTGWIGTSGRSGQDTAVADNNAREPGLTPAPPMHPPADNTADGTKAPTETGDAAKGSDAEAPLPPKDVIAATDQPSTPTARGDTDSPQAQIPPIVERRGADGAAREPLPRVVPTSPPPIAAEPSDVPPAAQIPPADSAATTTAARPPKDQPAKTEQTASNNEVEPVEIVPDIVPVPPAASPPAADASDAKDAQPQATAPPAPRPEGNATTQPPLTETLPPQEPVFDDASNKARLDEQEAAHNSPSDSAPAPEPAASDPLPPQINATAPGSQPTVPQLPIPAQPVPKPEATTDNTPPDDEQDVALNPPTPEVAAPAPTPETTDPVLPPPANGSTAQKTETAPPPKVASPVAEAEPFASDTPPPDGEQDVALNTPSDLTPSVQPVEPVPAVDPEDCYFAAIQTQSDDALSIKGVGLSLEPFERIKSALADSGSGNASMDSHLITVRQCPTTHFLKAIHDTTVDNPELSFTNPGTRRGDKVAGVLDNVGPRMLTVFMVDGSGRIFDLHADTIVTNSPPLFDLTLDEGRDDFVAPGLIVAVASERQIELATAWTAADLPALAQQLLARGDVTGIDFGFFPYGVVLETIAR